jgi:L-alanine-DL-glutamate epimerase-like enolase superfamily enzyme
LHCDAGWRVFSFLQLSTDEGLTGISEYNERYGCPGLTGVIERLAAHVLGSNPCAHERLSQQLYRHHRQAPGWHGRNRLLRRLENAVIDLKAKALGVPV